jgi:O-antigen/teichoic acid export membrane protein
MLKRNVVANFVGQAWGTVMSFAFVPAYIHCLGMDAYGVIGFFAVLQAWLMLLDLGFAQALSREMARWSACGHEPGPARDMLRTVELISVAIGAAVAAATWALAPRIASGWLQLGQFPKEQAEEGIRLMGLVIGVRLLEGTYRGCAMGLQRQVSVNLISVIVSTLRGAGAWAVLAWWDASLGAFFGWQLAATCIGALATARLVYANIPAPRPGRFSWADVGRLRGLAGGLAVSALLMTAIGQVDKAILSRMLVIDEFGLYVLASSLASGVTMLAAPVTGAVFPKLCELHARDSADILAATFHKSSQVLVVATGSLAAVLVSCPGLVLRAWTGDVVPRAEVEPLVRLLALGNFVNSLIWMPYTAYLAFGHVRRVVVLNSLLAATLVPLLVTLVPVHGVRAGPWIWLASNLAYVGMGVPFVFRRMRQLRIADWLLRDTLVPVAALAAACLSLAAILPSEASDRMTAVLLLAVAACVAVAAAVVAAPEVRAIAAAGIMRAVRSVPLRRSA